MYQYNYVHIKKADSENRNFKCQTKLDAVFLFGDEVAPCEKDRIRKRMSTSEASLNGLHEFLVLKGYTKDCHPDYPYYNKNGSYCNQNGSLNISPFKFRLGFRLNFKSRKYCALEDIIDLNAINDFVLHGMPKTTPDLELTPLSRDH